MNVTTEEEEERGKRRKSVPDSFIPHTHTDSVQCHRHLTWRRNSVGVKLIFKLKRDVVVIIRVQHTADGARSEQTVTHTQ